MPTPEGANPAAPSPAEATTAAPPPAAQTKPSLGKGKSVNFTVADNERGETIVLLKEVDPSPDWKGWTFANETAEWKRYHRAFVERVIFKHLRDRLNDIREGCNLAVVLIASVTTLITAVSAGIAGGAGSTDGDGCGSGESETCSTSWVACLQQYQTYGFILLSFMTTLISSFVQMQTPFWKRVDKDGRVLEQHYYELESHFQDNLELPVEQRKLGYDDFLKKRQELDTRLRQGGDLNVPESLRRRAVERVRRYDPSNWARAFLWLGPSLRWPVEKEINQAMLTEFSQGECGKYTARQPSTGEDELEYRKAYLRQKDHYFKRYRLSDRMGLRWPAYIGNFCESMDLCGCCCCLYGHAPSRMELRRLWDSAWCLCRCLLALGCWREKNKKENKIVRKRGPSQEVAHMPQRPSLVRKLTAGSAKLIASAMQTSSTDSSAISIRKPMEASDKQHSAELGGSGGGTSGGSTCPA